MKQFILVISLCVASFEVFGGAGFYDSFAIVDGNFFDLSAGTVNDDLQGANLGNIDLNTGTLFLGGQSKTFKNNGSDVTGVAIFYRFYQGAASGAFSQISYSFQWNNGDAGAPSGLNNSGDQQWGTDAQGANGSDVAVDILNGATLMTGTYTLEVYMRVTTNGVDASGEIFDNNGGSNYTATFTITNAMPVDFGSFLVKGSEQGHEIIFTTLTETENSHFDIQRSTNSQVWENLERLTGAGSTLERQVYNYLDKSPKHGVNYYRIKQVDFDGSFSYSKIVSANWVEKPRISIYPNPTSDQLQISGLSSTEQSVQIEVLSMSGKLLLQQQWQQASINLQHLPPGMYLLRVRSEQDTLDQRQLIIQ